MNDPRFISVPLVSDELLEQVYEYSSDPETSEEQLTLWTRIKVGLPEDLAALRQDPKAENAGATLIHRVTGYAASVGLDRCAAILHYLENSPDAAGSDPLELLDLAEEAARNGIAEVERRFPHLVRPPVD